VLGSPEWSKNPKYRDRRTITGQTADEVNALMIPWMLEHTKEEIFKICQDNGYPARRFTISLKSSITAR